MSSVLIPPLTDIFPPNAADSPFHRLTSRPVWNLLKNCRNYFPLQLTLKNVLRCV